MIFTIPDKYTPYKDAWSVDDAVAYIRKESGKQFDPSLVVVYIDFLPQVLQIRAEWMD